MENGKKTIARAITVAVAVAAGTAGVILLFGECGGLAALAASKPLGAALLLAGCRLYAGRGRHTATGHE